MYIKPQSTALKMVGRGHLVESMSSPSLVSKRIEWLENWTVIGLQKLYLNKMRSKWPVLNFLAH